jgi:hypothetical protein
MPIKVTDTIIGKSRGTAAKAKASFRERGALRMNDVAAYVDAVYALCEPDDMPDAAIVVSAGDVETGTFTNKWWKERLNAGSLGVTGWPPDDEASPTFASGAAAAKAHVAHLLLYATGQINRGGLTPADDPRYDAYRDAYGTRAFPILNDLSGRYAADPAYGATIARRSQVVYGDLPDQSSVTLPTEPEPEEPPMTKPTIILVAGHRSDGDSGNSNEKDRTDDMARAYLAAFKAAGYATRYVQNEDGDGRPDITSGGLDTVSSKTRQIMQGISGPMVLLDLHFEGAAARGVFAIVPDVTGLRTAVIGGAPTDDTWANNPLDVKLAGVISRRIAAATGLPIRATTQPGIMSERHTGVGYDGWRLATMAYSAWCRDRAVRLVVEHGSLPTSDVSIINQPGFYEKCAAAAVAAVNEVYAVSTPAPQPEPEPEPEPQPGQKHELPKGMTLQSARRLYGTLKVSWADDPFTFDPERSEGRAWLERGKAQLKEGERYDKAKWPRLVDVIRRGDGSRIFHFSDGWTYEQKAS